MNYWQAPLIALLLALPATGATHEPTAAPTPPSAPPDLAAQKADLRIALRDYVMASRAFTPLQRAAAINQLGEAMKRETPWSRPAFIAELMRLAAHAGNAHDYFDGGTGWFPDQRLPLRLAWFADGLVVVRAPPQHARLAGARVTHIDGKDLAEVMRRLQRHDGGPAEYIRWNKGWVLESAAMLHAVGIADAPDRARFAFRLRDGAEASVELADVPAAEVPLDQGGVGLYSSRATAQETAKGWVHPAPADTDPVYLQEATRQFRMLELPGLDALYVQFRGNYDVPGETVAGFVAQVQAELARTPRRHLVLDQRWNIGGNADLTLDLMRAIAARDTGRTYVLLGNRTFSAGIVSAALVESASGGRALLVGEPVGDRLRWWSEGGNTCLPATGYCLHLTTGLWDLVKGCEGEANCYGDKFGIRVEDLDPDLPAPLTSEAWLAGRDPGLEAIAADLAAHAPAPATP